MIRTAVALLAAVPLSACWGALSDVDLVGDAAVATPLIADGVYCPVQIWGGFADIDYEDCDRIGWDDRALRHYYAPAQLRWDDERGAPVAVRTLGGFGATSIWLDVADLGRGLALVQRATADGAEFDEAVDAPTRYVAFVICPDDGGFAVIPAADSAAIEALASGRGVTLAPVTLQETEARRVVSGETEEARAVVAESARLWLVARMEMGGDFRQRPSERPGVGPLYHVRIDGLDPEIPLTAGVESAMFTLEQRLRQAALGL